MEPLPKIWNSHWPFATSALMPSWLMPAARQRSRCSSTISRATSADVRVADAGVIRALRRGIAAGRGSRADGRPCRRSIPARSRTMRRRRRGWWRACSWRAASCRRASSLRTSPARRWCARRPGKPRPASARNRSCGPPPAWSSFRRSPTAEAARASEMRSNSLICVLPRRFGVGVYPSSQIYSSLYFVIELSHELMMRKVGEPMQLVGHHRCTRPPSAILLTSN